MRNLFIVLTIVSAASAFPLPFLEDDLNLFSSDPGLDTYSIGLDDPSQSFLLAGSDTGNTNEIPPTTDAPASSGDLLPGFDPDVYDIPWSIIPKGGDSSWTGVNRPSPQSDGSYLSPEEKLGREHSGQDYEGNYGINPDANGPTNFQLSPEQTAALVKAGTLVVGGVTWVYNGVTGAITSIGNALGGFIPQGAGGI